MSKTNLKQKKDIVEAIKNEGSIVASIKLLRDWLNDNGYEGSDECKHYAILRTSGKCMACGLEVAEPMILDSDDALRALRRRLGDPIQRP